MTGHHGHHMKPKPSCAQQRARHHNQVRALRAMVAKLKKRLAHKHANKPMLRRRIAQARKEITLKLRCS